MKKLTLNLIALVLLAGNAAAFDLAGMGADDIRAAQTDFRAPAPQAQRVDDLIGIDMNIRIPYATIKNGVEKVAASDRRLTIMDKNAPVAFKYGEFLRVSNIKIDQGGIIVIPTLTLKPSFAGTDKLAIRVQRIQLHASMEPSLKAAPMPAINEEEIMVQVMDVLIKGTYSAVGDFLKKKQIPMKAEDVIKLRYDKAAWTLHAQISSKVMNHFIPGGLVGELHLTGFSFNEKGLVLNIQTPQ
ncbi:MAG: hypothetical protein A2X35_00350 [Elusimicrobia bacterium GWA2_61_42]|nr:MAG: hypothetical protein A2X35_00350 [Elusimicrobia bacterium GWA2_61_42]OGR74545.1 MAG: hypothetical protein A2X38_08100 [Elusimicrobia bacterium GWC2_61_25]